MSPKEILEKASWNKDTAYVDQITFVGDDGFKISIPRSKEGMSRKEAEDALIEAVQDHYA